MLTLHRLSRPGLGPIDLELPDGSCATIEGASGSGKTLLLRAIADLDPTTGEVRLDGVPRDSLPAPSWRRRVCYLAAEPGWWSERPREHFANWSSALPLLDRLGLEPEIGARPLRLLSTGERLRLALVRMLVIDPEVMLLDEPTGPLDPIGKASVEALLADRLAAGRTLLMVTHDSEQARRIATSRYVMANGRLGPWAE